MHGGRPESERLRIIAVSLSEEGPYADRPLQGPPDIFYVLRSLVRKASLPEGAGPADGVGAGKRRNLVFR
jgi:hypothetical protein